MKSKTFFDLLHNWKFLMYFLIILAIILWNLLSGSRIIAFIFLALLVAVILINLYKTK